MTFVFSQKFMHKAVLDPGADRSSLPTYCIPNSLLAGRTIRISVMPTFMQIWYSGVELYITVMSLKVVGMSNLLLLYLNDVCSCVRR